MDRKPQLSLKNAGGPSPAPELQRVELLERLELAQPKVLALIAPAGFGKSTLLRQHLNNGRPSAICDCNGLRDDLDFARRLLPALAAANPARERGLARRELLLGDGGVSAAQRTGIALDAWREPFEGTIAFENAEHIAASPEARDFFARLLGALPEGRSVAICSRDNLRLHFTRFAAPHEIVVLRAPDLAFDADDVRQIFAPHLVEDAVLDRVLSVSQGWPIAVLLLKRFAAEGRIGTLLDRLGDVAFEELHDYLADQVLATFDPSLVQAIFACVAIPRATSEDLHAAFIDRAAVAELEAFAQDSSFLTRDAHGAFGVHPLLASLLAHDRDQRRADLLSTVADHYEAQGDFERAAELHLARGDQEAAAQALGRHEVTLDRSPSMTYASVLSSLERDLVQRYPRLWGVTCLLRVFCTDMEALFDETESIWRTMPLDTPPVERFYVFVFRVVLMNYIGRLDEAEAAIAELAALMGTSGTAPDPLLGAGMLYLSAIIAARKGRLADAERDFTTALPVISRMDAMAAGTFVTLGADIARVRGERALERQFIDHAIELARKSTTMNFAALDLAEATFGAWLAGEEEAFVHFAAQLAECVAQAGAQGLAYFSAIAGGVAREPGDGQSMRHVALGRLIAATRCADDAEAAQHAQAALEAARRYDSGFVEALAAIAIALCDEAEFESAMEIARAAAARCDSQPLHDAVDAVARRRDAAGFLQPFVRRFTFSRRRSVAPLEVDLTTGAVRVLGRDVRLSGREAELLFALAMHREPISRARLAAILWPEQDEDAARNALSVCLHRARRHLGDDAIVRESEGYRLRDGAVVDLWDLERTVAALRLRSALDESDRMMLSALADRLKAPRSSRMDEWEWFAPIARRLNELRVEITHRLASDALGRNEARTALIRAEEILAYDPYDEPACEIALRAHLALGDRASAQRQFRHYRDLLMAELQVEPSAALARLVTA